jgi:hypothetical protein
MVSEWLTPVNGAGGKPEKSAAAIPVLGSKKPAFLTKAGSMTCNNGRFYCRYC